MKTFLILLTTLSLISGLSFAGDIEFVNGIAPTITPGADIEFGVFLSALASHGEWLEIRAGFHVWRPHRTQSQWRPYLYGRWAWTDYGWYWVSSEPYGWAVYHYGRWYYDDYYGWIWIPDEVWGPAWVEWRYNDDYIGWAPLPPYAHFSFNLGLHFSLSWNSPFHYWNFTRYRHFGSHTMVNHIEPMSYTRRIIGSTRSIRQFEYTQDRIMNRGLEPSMIERRGSTRITRTDIIDRSTDGERTIRDRDRERIEVYRPGRTELSESRGRVEIRTAERSPSLDFDRIMEGRRLDNDSAIRRSEGTARSSEEQRPARSDEGATRRNETESRQQQIEERSAQQTPQRTETRSRQSEQRPSTIEERIRESRKAAEQQREEQRREMAPSKNQPEAGKRSEGTRSQPNIFQQQQERREATRERNTREQQREVRRESSPPAQRIEPPRSNPPAQRESSRGTESKQRESGRRRG
ncbi:MAG: DUF6600 domain-containing protein [bacterium]